jgi:hypothetical protein
MTTTTTTVAQGNNRESLKDRFWSGLVSLKPLKKFIGWGLRGMAICAVPLIIGCTIVIGIELASADWFSKGFGLVVANTTEDLLNAAIEGSMLGCIALSKQARKDGNTKQARVMYWLGWLFAILTMITVGFRVFHASAEAGMVLLWIRCGAGIVFCYLSHLDDDDNAEEVTPQQHRTQMEQLTETFNQQVQQLTTAFNQQITQVTTNLSTIQTSVENQLTEISAKGLNDFQLKGMEETFQRLIERHAETLKPVDQISIESIQAIVTETHSAFQSAFAERLSTLQNTVSVVPDLAEKLTRIERDAARQSQELKAQLKQAEAGNKAMPRPAEKEMKAPLKFVKKESVNTEVNKKAFVIECLTEDSTMTIGNIQRRATEKGFEVSVGTISTVRKTFNEGTERGTETLTENTTIAPTETAIESQTEDSAAEERVS